MRLVTVVVEGAAGPVSLTRVGPDQVVAHGSQRVRLRGGGHTTPVPTTHVARSGVSFDSDVMAVACLVYGVGLRHLPDATNSEIHDVRDLLQRLGLES